jgi:hypothetical protein
LLARESRRQFRAYLLVLTVLLDRRGGTLAGGAQSARDRQQYARRRERQAGPVPALDRSGEPESSLASAQILLSLRIPILEGLTNLDQLLGKQFRFIALPLKIAGADGSPVRAIAILR